MVRVLLNSPVLAVHSGLRSTLRAVSTNFLFVAENVAVRSVASATTNQTSAFGLGDDVGFLNRHQRARILSASESERRLLRAVY